MTKKLRVSEITGSLAELIHEVTVMGGYKDVRMMLSSVFSDLQRNGYHVMHPQQLSISEPPRIQPGEAFSPSNGRVTTENATEPQLDFIEYDSTDSMFGDDDNDE